jgi:hypothetical protein
MPRRKFENVADFESCMLDADELIFDGTENLTERPQSNEKQRDKYSGKKKTHTDVAMVLSDKKTRIYYVSEYYDGKHNDMGILKNEFAPHQDWFVKFKVLFDLGFVGVDKLYKFKELIIGEKKDRKSKNNPKPELSEQQKIKNKAVSRERIFVEHAIGKMKRYRILKNRCRLKCMKIKNRILGIAAALWNYQMELKC